MLPNRSTRASISCISPPYLNLKEVFFNSLNAIDTQRKDAIVWKWWQVQILSYAVPIVSQCFSLIVSFSLWKLFWLRIYSAIQIRMSMLVLAQICLTKKYKKFSDYFTHRALRTWFVSSALAFSTDLVAVGGIAIFKTCLKHAIDEMCDWRNGDCVQNKLN